MTGKSAAEMVDVQVPTRSPERGAPGEGTAVVPVDVTGVEAAVADTPGDPEPGPDVPQAASAIASKAALPA